MKTAAANVSKIRRTTQYSCCAASIASAISAFPSKDISEDDVNKVLGASPMSGASWESMLATLQYFGMRGSLVVPATPRMLKEWTDKGLPVLIGWNPEGRPWSHASVVFDVTEGPEGLMIHVMDPNIPNPSKTVRVVPEDEFCQKWSEKMNDKLIMRRPACVVELEVTAEGRQVRASVKDTPASRVAKLAGSALDSAYAMLDAAPRGAYFTFGSSTMLKKTSDGQWLCMKSRALIGGEKYTVEDVVNTLGAQSILNGSVN